MRRYDIDWLRVLALGLLIIYHAIVSFQPWGYLIAFPQNEDFLEKLWIPMGLINIWRIPILFIISGMGVRFAMGSRNWRALLKDRTIRIFVPYIFGFFFICPINLYLASIYYKEIELGGYIPNPGHLWFLGNIFTYVLLLLIILVYLKNNPDNSIFRFLKNTFRRPFGIYIMSLPFLIEALLLQPNEYASFANTPHGFWLGIICFLTGFILISLKDVFWKAVSGVKRWALAIALLLYWIRLIGFELGGPNVLQAFESFSWMLAIFGFGSSYLNKPSKQLAYLSQAVYPVYILHMPLQFFFSLFILPLALPAIFKLLLVLIGTFCGSLLLYDLIIKRLKFIRPLFGLKI